MPRRCVISGAKVATLADAVNGDDLLEDPAIVVDGERVAWIGSAADPLWDKARLACHDPAGRLVAPVQPTAGGPSADPEDPVRYYANARISETFAMRIPSASGAAEDGLDGKPTLPHPNKEN